MRHNVVAVVTMMAITGCQLIHHRSPVLIRMIVPVALVSAGSSRLATMSVKDNTTEQICTHYFFIFR